MLGYDANADAFPVVASLGDRKYVCARRLNLCPTTFQLCYTLDGVNVTSSDMPFLKQKKLFVGLESWFPFSAWLCFENVKVYSGSIWNHS